jgi:hypothetical protein
MGLRKPVYFNGINPELIKEEERNIPVFRKEVKPKHQKYDVIIPVHRLAVKLNPDEIDKISPVLVNVLLRNLS